MVHRILKFAIFGFIAIAACSCVKNDLPYPYIESVIEEIGVYDMKGEPVIDAASNTVSITVGELADVSKLQITKLKVSEDAEIIPDKDACASFEQFPNKSFASLDELPANANTVVDFTKTVRFVLKTYQEHVWNIKVTQEIDRVVEVEKQVGSALIDPQSKIAIIYVEKETSLDDIHINKLQLEGESAEARPDPTTVTDFTRPRTFEFYRNDVLVSTWIVDVQPSVVLSTPVSANAWATKVSLYGEMKSGATPSVEYKKTTDSEWSVLPAENIEVAQTSFTAELEGLENGTEYQWRILVDGEYSETVAFTTEKIIEIPNLNFDTWSQSGKNWFANGDNADSYWATGNTGVTSTLAGGKDPITTRSSDAVNGYAAEMHTITGITLVGTASGNLFIGSYKTNMSNPSASVTFGREYDGARPTKLKGFYKYKSMPITAGTKPGNLQNDECHIYMRLWDASGKEIAYGEFVGTETVTEYTPFEFNLEYNDNVTKPAKITIVATSSHYGGEFEGVKVVGQVGEGSTLWVDEFELSYE
ncbi:PCMD domain-containing protein [Bacteroides caecigallinarum]|uniref:PCMD domain-containing protein n=1 Tax=Bacteroides caecigallinarum TaxID=1411144 RepID=UPI001F319C06|nr:PCMD domain-containing protein [Bacteroides caecigallinarum]MCF2593380.1 PCMD domain-containing protein [Bacteroides caecigallinarum]